MAVHTFPFVCSIIGVENEHEGYHVGTGFRLSTSTRRMLVTAKHVLDQARAAPLGVAFVHIRGEPPVRLASDPDIVDPMLDLAVWVLEGADDDEASGARFWPVSLLDGDGRARAHDYLFVHGFPGERARFVFGESHHRSLPYGVMERDDDLPADARSFEFAMDYDPKNMQLESGGDASLVLPGGLSGSPVWRIGAYHRKPEAWSPEASRLVGVVTRWNPDKRVLLATDVASLLKLL
jgi:hypothetical protein